MMTLGTNPFESLPSRPPTTTRQPRILDAMFGDEHVQLFQRSGAPELPVVAHGSLARLSEIADIPALESAMTLFDHWNGHDGVVRAWPSARTTAKVEIRPTTSELVPFYLAGYSIYIMNLEQIVPELEGVCRRLERELDVPLGSVYAEAFCSIATSGATPHFDDTDTFNIQLAGEKVWSFAPNPAVRFPTSGLVLGATLKPPRALERVMGTEPLPTEMPASTTTRVTTHAGTVVFVPNGVLHATHAERESFSVLFTLRPKRLAASMARQVKRELRGLDVLRASHLDQRGMERDSVEAAVYALRACAEGLRRSATKSERKRLEDTALRLHPAIRIDRSGAISLQGRPASRTMGHEVAKVLRWISNQEESSFTIRDLAEGLTTFPVRRLRATIKTLIRSGVLVRKERAQS